MASNELIKSIFGWIATVFSLTYKIPQIYVLYREKRHKGLSIMSLICQALAYAFYVIHGYINHDLPILCMGAVSGLQSILLIVLYCLYKNKETNR